MDLVKTLEKMRGACPVDRCNVWVELRKTRWDAILLVLRWRYKHHKNYKMHEQEIWIPRTGMGASPRLVDEIVDSAINRTGIQMHREIEKQR